MGNDTELPDGVRRVPGPAVHWTIQRSGMVWDGYVFEDDPSDLARFIRWLAEDPHPMDTRLQLQKVYR